MRLFKRNCLSRTDFGGHFWVLFELFLGSFSGFCAVNYNTKRSFWTLGAGTRGKRAQMARHFSGLGGLGPEASQQVEKEYFGRPRLGHFWGPKCGHTRHETEFQRLQPKNEAEALANAICLAREENNYNCAGIFRVLGASKSARDRHNAVFPRKRGLQRQALILCIF